PRSPSPYSPSSSSSFTSPPSLDTSSLLDAFASSSLSVSTLSPSLSVSSRPPPHASSSLLDSFYSSLPPYRPTFFSSAVQEHSQLSSVLPLLENSSDPILLTSLLLSLYSLPFVWPLVASSPSFHASRLILPLPSSSPSSPSSSSPSPSSSYGAYLRQFRLDASHVDALVASLQGRALELLLLLSVLPSIASSTASLHEKREVSNLSLQTSPFSSHSRGVPTEHHERGRSLSSSSSPPLSLNGPRDGDMEIKKNTIEKDCLEAREEEEEKEMKKDETPSIVDGREKEEEKKKGASFLSLSLRDAFPLLLAAFHPKRPGVDPDVIERLVLHFSQASLLLLSPSSSSSLRPEMSLWLQHVVFSLSPSTLRFSPHMPLHLAASLHASRIPLPLYPSLAPSPIHPTPSSSASSSPPTSAYQGERRNEALQRHNREEETRRRHQQDPRTLQLIAFPSPPPYSSSSSSSLPTGPPVSSSPGSPQSHFPMSTVRDKEGGGRQRLEASVLLSSPSSSSFPYHQGDQRERGFGFSSLQLTAQNNPRGEEEEEERERGAAGVMPWEVVDQVRHVTLMNQTDIIQHLIWKIDWSKLSVQTACRFFREVFDPHHAVLSTCAMQKAFSSVFFLSPHRFRLLQIPDVSNLLLGIKFL
ncbi:hypothetical protein CSUI_006573, partial [Cystoisospora suis]